jgi:TolA-binding protein
MQEQIGALTAELNAMKAATQESNAGTSASGKKADQFDVAEDLFAKKDWKRAILNYQKFRESNPRSKKVPEAIYKIGVSFQELGMKDEARTFFDEVIAKFPNSAEAKKARTRLKSVKK